MTLEESLQCLRAIRDVAMATVDENGDPQVRIIDMMLAEGEKLIFCTARGKDVYRQLSVTGKVAVTGMDPHYRAIRLNGTVERLQEQKEWIDRIFAANPSMNAIYPGENRYILEAFSITPQEVESFDVGKEPLVRENILQRAGREKGFLISDQCIGCGTCAADCPQQCIEVGEPYRIVQSHCLHCGLCQENCPVSAITRKG